MYMTLKLTHMGLALASVLLFAGRGGYLLATQRRVASRLLRVLPHAIDTLLLASGLWLMTMTGQYPLAAPWLGVKLILLVVYIVLGIAVFRMARSRGVRAALFVLALAVFGYIVAVARAHHPLGPVLWIV